jgi:NitT/TauT family transport system substrate-binding protein
VKDVVSQIQAQPIGRRAVLRLGAATAAAAAFGSRGSHAQEGKVRIRLGHLPITDHLTVIAKSRARFEKLTLEPVKFASWPELAEALKSGSLEAAFALTPISLTLRQKGAPIKIVLLGHRNGSVLLAANDISKVSDLRGKTIAIPSRFSTHNLLLRRLLAREGLDADRDVTLTELPPPEMVQALARGGISAFIVAEPFGAQAELRKLGKVLALSKDIWPNHVCCALNAREDLIAAHPDAVQELVSALTAAGHFATEHPQEAAQLSKPFLGQDPAVVLHAMIEPKGRVTHDDLVPTLADLSATQDDMLKYKLATARVDLPRFLDDRFARAAQSAAKPGSSR